MARDCDRRFTGPRWSRSSQLRLSMVATVPYGTLRNQSDNLRLVGIVKAEVQLQQRILRLAGWRGG